MKSQRASRDLTGQKFGRLFVIERADDFGAGNRKWKCRCDCGNEKEIQDASLYRGLTKSCGCVLRERKGDLHPNKTHGMTGTKELRTWRRMHRRCADPKVERFPNYGGRGIKVCERWKLFENFLSDMGLAPGPKHSIERKDNDGDYTPENCKWGTDEEQRRNTRRTRMLEIDGVKRTMAEWARISFSSPSRIFLRLARGVPEKEAVFQPAYK